jgi:hypothetical protein
MSYPTNFVSPVKGDVHLGRPRATVPIATLGRRYLLLNPPAIELLSGVPLQKKSLSVSISYDFRNATMAVQCESVARKPPLGFALTPQGTGGRYGAIAVSSLKKLWGINRTGRFQVSSTISEQGKRVILIHLAAPPMMIV